MIENLRIGSGFDVHAFIRNKPLMLGGIEIPYEYGLEGHSDADALIHAVVDSILGALGEGDIGQHFPPSDSKWKGASSSDFLAYCRDLVAKKGAKILSIDATLILELPKIAPHAAKMRAHMAKVLRIELDRLHLKATTTEGLGFTGRKEGIAAQAVCLLALRQAKN